MPDKSSVLIYGLDELASAVARTLLLAGHAVALHETAPPPVLRRKMSFVDAWYDGIATLGGVEARRADHDTDLLIGLRSGMYVPLLTHPQVEAVGRWPWDVLIDARGDISRPSARRRSDAELTIVLGPGGVAGQDCDLVIEIGGRDPGAVVRDGGAKAGRRAFARHEGLACAPADGVFRTERAIGEVVEAGELIGIVGTTLVLAPQAGRLRGLQRSPRAVREGEPLAELVSDTQAQVSGIDRTDQMIARAVEFAIEVEEEGLPLNLWTGH